MKGVQGFNKFVADNLINQNGYYLYIAVGKGSKDAKYVDMDNKVREDYLLYTLVSVICMSSINKYIKSLAAEEINKNNNLLRKAFEEDDGDMIEKHRSIINNIIDKYNEVVLITNNQSPAFQSSFPKHLPTSFDDQFKPLIVFNNNKLMEKLRITE